MLCEPLEIPLSNAAYRSWMTAAGLELKRLDALWYDVQTNYFRHGNGEEAYLMFGRETVDVMCDLLGLQSAIAATFALWKQLRDEMD
jgi:hypothetical protein